MTSQNTYRTKILNNHIQSLLITPEGAPLANPVIHLGNQKICLSFDDLDATKKDLYYRVILCNADWTAAKNVSTTEYMKGFSENPILNSAFSFNTNIPYIHYILTLPNEDVTFKNSGNYALEIFDLEDPDSTLAVACFSISEGKVSITGKVETLVQNKDDGSNQYLNFSILHPNYNFRNTDKDLKIAVIQNHRYDDIRWLSTPTFNRSKELVYDNEPKLFFQGGNEYRRFDITDRKVSGMWVQNIQYIQGFFHFNLRTDQELFGRKSYTYSPDNNGKVFYQLEDNENYTNESDYCFVHFALYVQDPYLRGSIHLNGDLMQGYEGEESKMLYNFDTHCYEKTLLLKQGVFEYQYLFSPLDQKNKLSPTKTEGNYWQTENDYLIYVYDRPVGAKYDHLIGFSVINSGSKK